MHSACIFYVLMTLFTMMTAEADCYFHRLGRQAIVGATDHLKVVENLSLVSYPQAQKEHRNYKLCCAFSFFAPQLMSIRQNISQKIDKPLMDLLTIHHLWKLVKQNYDTHMLVTDIQTAGLLTSPHFTTQVGCAAACFEKTGCRFYTVCRIPDEIQAFKCAIHLSLSYMPTLSWNQNCLTFLRGELH